MRRKVIQLVHNEDEDTYALYEAIIDTEFNIVEWIAEEPIELCESYHDAINKWVKREKKYSCILDILQSDEYERIRNRENEEISELNF